MTIEESRRYFEAKMHWYIHEETFKVIEEETCTWVAEATERNNVSFFLLVQGYHYFILEKRWRHRLGE